MLGSDEMAWPGRFRWGRLNEVAGVCGGRGRLWVLNRIQGIRSWVFPDIQGLFEPFARTVVARGLSNRLPDSVNNTEARNVS
jgi:hypothetical protein